jgi:hypothetical protein
MSAPDSVLIDALLDRVEKSSADFADRATVLSETIERVAATLIGMPGKSESRVSDDDGHVELTFDKLPNWNLWVIDPECEYDSGERQAEPLTNISIPRKTRAFPLLLRLLGEIDDSLNAQVAEIDAAIGSLDGQPRKLDTTKKREPAKPPAGLKQTGRPQPVVTKEVNDDLPF